MASDSVCLDIRNTEISVYLRSGVVLTIRPEPTSVFDAYGDPPGNNLIKFIKYYAENSTENREPDEQTRTIFTVFVNGLKVCACPRQRAND